MTVFTRTLATASRNRNITMPEAKKLEAAVGKELSQSAAKVLLDLVENGPGRYEPTSKAPAVTAAAANRIEAFLAQKGVPFGAARDELEVAVAEAFVGGGPEVDKFPSHVTKLPRFAGSPMARDDFDVVTVFVDVKRKEAWASRHSAPTDDESGHTPARTTRVGPIPLP